MGRLLERALIAMAVPIAFALLRPIGDRATLIAARADQQQIPGGGDADPQIPPSGNAEQQQMPQPSPAEQQQVPQPSTADSNQPTAPRADADQAPVFTSQSDLVVLHLSIKDRKGAYVPGLAADAFEVFENKQLQPIQFFISQDAPVTVGLLIDSSGSMSSNRELVIAAATSFAESSNSEDEIFALAFNDDVKPVLPHSAPFTADPETLRRAMTAAIVTRGRTALYDALAAGLEYLGRGSRERKVLVVVSDGGDNASRTTAEEIWKQTQASNVLVYTVALIDETEREANPKALKRIANATGGEAFRARSVRDVDEVLRRIATDIRHAYTVGYAPINSAHDGRFRNVRVVVHPPDRRSVEVRTRTGYVAGNAQRSSR